MNVWVLWLVRSDLDGETDAEVAGIYSSRELAERAAEHLNVQDGDVRDIEEFVVDAPTARPVLDVPPICPDCREHDDGTRTCDPSLTLCPLYGGDPNLTKTEPDA